MYQSARQELLTLRDLIRYGVSRLNAAQVALGPVSYTHLDVYKRQQQVIPHGRPVSPCMYRHGEAGVERFVPPHDELRQRQANLARMLAKGDYDAQKEALEHLYEEQGIDVFVATYNLFVQNGDADASFSLATRCV